MENSKNSSLINFFKDIGSTIGKILASDDEIDNDVELPAELSGDPILALNDFQSTHGTVQIVQQRKTRMPKVQTKSTRSKSLDKDEQSR